MRHLTRWLVMPLLLLLLWRALNDRLSLAGWVLGAAIAITLSLLAPKLRPVRARLSHPVTALRLLVHVGIDIAKSTVAVGWRILQGDASPARPEFLHIPLRLTDPHGLAMLSCIVTFTPGTVWAGHDPQRQILTLHVLDLHDPEGLTHIIQDRYEAPLMEIFE